MPKQTLPTNFKDEILAPSMGGRQRFHIIENDDGTISLEDVTEYEQEGSDFGAEQVNATNEAVNKNAEGIAELNSKLTNNLANGVTEFVIGEHLVIIIINKAMSISNLWHEVATTTNIPPEEVQSVVTADNGLNIGRISVNRFGKIQVAIASITNETTKTVNGEIVYVI